MTRRMGMLAGALLLVGTLSDLGAQEKRKEYIPNEAITSQRGPSGDTLVTETIIPHGPIEGFLVIPPGAAFRDFGIRIGKAIPNQCPVCGTMAPSYRRPRGAGEFITCTAPAQNVVCVGPGEPYGPTERLTRCRICNAAFWQDAEDEGQGKLRDRMFLPADTPPMVGCWSSPCTPESVRPTKRYYWYSNRQENMVRWWDERTRQVRPNWPLSILVGGKRIYYTEVTDGSRPWGWWDDYVLVHIEEVGKP